MSEHTKELKLTSEQRAVIFDTVNEAVVVAAAGCGKTTVLTEHIINRAIGVAAEQGGEAVSQLDLSRLLVVTFTKAAANTLRERLGSRLNEEMASTLAEAEAGKTDPAVLQQLARLRQQLSGLGRARVSTIHSFCQDVIQRYGHIAGIESSRILDDAEARGIRHEICVEFLDRALGQPADSELRSLAMAWGGLDGLGPEDLASTQHDSGLKSLVLSLHEFRSSLINPTDWYENNLTIEKLDPECFDPAHPRLAGLLKELHAWAEGWLAEFAAEQQRVRACKADAVHLGYLASRTEALEQLSQAEDWGEFAARLDSLFQKQDGLAGRRLVKYKYRAVATRVDDLAKVDAALASEARAVSKRFEGEAADYRTQFAGSWEETALRENAVATWLIRLWSLVSEFGDRYSAYKRQRGVIDFADQERLALSILLAGEDADGRPLPSEAALELRGHFQAVLVDEYQDVNPLQNAILNLVVADAPIGNERGRAFFTVGDLKQSIYTFRQADPRLFAARQQTLAVSEQAGKPCRVFPLRVNFRTRETLLQAINHLFGGLMTAAFGGEDYGPQTQLVYGGLYEQRYRDLPPGYAERPAGLHLVLREAGVATEEQASREELVYQRTARVLHEIHAEQIDGQPRLLSAGGNPRAVKWRDMAILVRSLSQVDDLKRILEGEGIPVYAPSRSGFYERPEIVDALALLSILENPHQDVPLAAVLRGPLGGLEPAELLNLARPPGMEEARRHSLWERAQYCLAADTLAEPTRTKLQLFVELFQQWRKLSRSVSLPELLWDIYQRGGILTAAASLVGGQQRVANLLELHNIALRFARAGQHGVTRFVAQVRQGRAAATDAGEAPLLSEGQDAVQIMTIHKAKGLEFPVVILPYLNRQFNTQGAQGNLLAHPYAGLAGLHLDLAEGTQHQPGNEPRRRLPRKRKSLGYDRVKQAIEHDLLAEELRLLYVATTRARERLELVVALDAVADGDSLRLKPGWPTGGAQEARRPWDWVASALVGSVAPRLAEHGISIDAGEAEPSPAWDITVTKSGDELPSEQVAPPAAAVSEQVVDEGALDRLRQLHSFKYAAPGSATLPAKLSVSRLASAASDEADGLVVAEQRREVSKPVSQQTRQAELGSLVHWLLARLNPATEVVVGDITELLKESPADEELKARVPSLAIAEALADLRQACGGFAGASLSSELPFSMWVKPTELPRGLGPDPASCRSADRVLVQGAIDLLVVWPDRALVLDYKLSRAPAAVLLSQYGWQLRWYTRAVGEMLPQLEDKISWAVYGIDGAGLIRGDEQS